MRRKEREVEDIAEIESIISRSDVCRVAIANNNIPYIVTMNFGYTGGENPHLYFHCAHEGRKLDMIRRNNYVCFGMDTDHAIFKDDKGCDWGMKYSSVVGYGKIFIVDDDTEKIAGLGHIMDHYGGSGVYSFDAKVLERTTVLRLEISEISSKRKN
jgi:nitroimidazol reductase NimA-like FMN-containing flavoprotein (pyridoxamine 5'-phosphate oxidase superfamily)